MKKRGVEPMNPRGERESWTSKDDLQLEGAPRRSQNGTDDPDAEF